MTTSSTPTETWRERNQSLARLLSAALALVALVLAVMVWQAFASDASESIDPGETFPLQSEPYGREVTVLLPGGEVDLVVGAPVETIGYGLLEVEYDDPDWDDQGDLGAADGGRLVPLVWQSNLTGGFVAEGEPKRIEVRLVAGDERVDLGESLSSADRSGQNEPVMVAVGIGEDVGVDDLRVEVSYDGVTQTVDVVSGEIDAGVAQPLYEEEQDFTVGCTAVEDSCEITADPTSPLRPVSSTFTASYLSLYPYDAELGWAEEGKLWAAVLIQTFGTSGVQNEAGQTWGVRRQSAPVITLDGAEPAQREGLTASEFESYGRVVFEVDSDVTPRELALEQVLSLRGPGAPDDLAITARRELTPVR